LAIFPAEIPVDADEPDDAQTETAGEYTPCEDDGLDCLDVIALASFHSLNRSTP